MAAHAPAAQRRPGSAWLATAFREVRRVRLDRLIAVLALLSGIALVLVETPIGSAAYDVPAVVALVLAILHAGAIPGALRLPNTAALTALAAVSVLQVLSAPAGAPVWPWWPVLIVTQSLVLGAAATRLHWPVALLHWIVALVVSATLAALLRPDAGDGTAVNLVVFGSIAGAVVAVALLATQWHRIRSELLHERRIAADEAARRVVVEERTRIARELHDVIAHSMSIITVQSSTARFRHPDLGPTAVEELDRIGALSRQALDEMRGLLRVLRGAEDETELRPQPGFADIAELVAQAGRAGTPVTLELVDDGPHEVGELTGLAAYRIVQEAISNAIRHAPGAAVRVACLAHEDRLDVSIVNGPAAHDGGAARLGPPGHGLVGMAERAASVGGSVRFGPAQDGGFAVRAALPLRAAIQVAP